MAHTKSIDTSIIPNGFQVAISDQMIPSGADVSDLLTAMEKNPTNQKGAIFVKVPESVFSRFLPQLLKLKYQFHAHDQTENQQPSFVYYKWIDQNRTDNVSPQATSLDHFCILVYSPDTESVLMVNENDKWKLVTGPVTKDSGIITGMVAYLSDRFYIAPNPDYTPVYVGGWIREKGHHGFIHDRMDCFAVKATKVEFRIPPEVKQVRWVPIRELKSAAIECLQDMSKQANPQDALKILDPDVIMFNGVAYNKYHVGWVAQSIGGGNLRISYSKVAGSNNLLFMMGNM